jgi:hypothetical protein
MPPTQRASLQGHTAPVQFVAFSPDGATIASGSQDNSIILWDLATGNIKHTLEGHTSYVQSIAFSPDAATIASASDDGTVILWDAASGTNKRTLEGHSYGVCAVAFSPDGSTIVSGSHDNSIILWDATTGEMKHTLYGHTDPVYSVAFSVDGESIASGSEDATVILWDAESGQVKQTLNGHTGSVTCVAFSPDAATIASASCDCTVILWDVVSGQIRQSLNGHTGNVYSVAFSPDGAIVAGAGTDSSIIIWDTATGQIKHSLKGHASYVSSVAFSPDAATIVSASADKTIIVWDATTGHRSVSVFGPFPNRVNTVWFDEITGALNYRDGEHHSHQLSLPPSLPSPSAVFLSQQPNSGTPDPASVPAALGSSELLSCEAVEEFCVFASQLITPAWQRIREKEKNPMSSTISEIPIVTKGLEADRRRVDLAGTMLSLEEQLRLCEVDYSLDATELEVKLRVRDTARVEAVRLWNLIQIQRDELADYLREDFPMPNASVATKEYPSPRDIYATIEQEALTQLKHCIEHLVNLVDRFTTALNRSAESAWNVTSEQHQEARRAAMALRDALTRSSATQIEAEFERQKRQLVTLAERAEETLSEVAKTINDLQQDMQKIIDITKAFPFGSDGTTPRVVALNELVAVKSNFVDPVEVCRHKKNLLHVNLQFYQNRDPAKWAASAKEMETLDAELTILAEAFTTAYDDVVMKTRVAFPELEEYVHTNIDPCCGQGNFRMDLGPADFTMVKLYGETVFKANPTATVAEAKKLDSIYVIKKFSVLASFLQELAVMRNAQAAGKHHENVAEACFSFSQKDLSGVVYYYIGLPFYRCPSPDWFAARIKSGEKGAIVQAMEGMVKGLDCLHRNQIVHGDVKPANLLFDCETASGIAKWIDFNFSANRSATLKLRGLTTVSAVGYSEGFTPREQRDNLILSPEGDVYALGKTFAALLFVGGCSPWEKDEREVGTWLGDEVERLFGQEIHAQIVTMIQCMTRDDEAQRISLLTDGDCGASVLSRLESIRKAL